MFRLKLNCSVICVRPNVLVELIESSPAIVEKFFSSGVATEEAMVSALAPAKLALTVMVGKSTVGRSLTGERLVTEHAEDQDADHHQRGGHRPTYEQSGDVHDAPRFPSPCSVPLAASSCRPSASAVALSALRRRFLDVHARFRTKQKLSFTDDHFADGEAFGDHRFAFVESARP